MTTYLVLLLLLLSGSPGTAVGAAGMMTVADQTDSVYEAGNAIVKAVFHVFEQQEHNKLLKQMASTSYSAEGLSELTGVDTTTLHALYAYYRTKQGYEPSKRTITEILAYVNKKKDDKVFAAYLSGELQDQIAAYADYDLGFLGMFAVSYQEAADLTGVSQDMTKLLFTMMDEEEAPAEIVLGDLAAFLVEQADEIKNTYGVKIPQMDLIQEINEVAGEE